MLQNRQIGAMEENAEGRSDALESPLGRIASGMDITAPREPGSMRASQDRGPASPKEETLECLETLGGNRKPIDRPGKRAIHIRTVGMRGG
jgi:hypothetical protein